MDSRHKRAYLSGPYDLKLKDVETPKVSGEQVLVEVKAAGICGSDVACYTGKSKEGRYDIAPYVPGHEWSGEVVDVGENILTLKKGDRVTSDCCLPCNRCDNCKDGLNPAYCKNLREVGFMPHAPGGMGEFLVIEEPFLHKLSDDMTYEEGALVEPFSVSYFGIWGDGGYVDASDEVLIFGAGPIGLFAGVVAKVAGARVITVDPIKYRREMAAKLGVDEVIDPETQNVRELISDLTKGRGINLVVECSGTNEAIALAFDIAAHGARIRFIGHSIGRKVPVEIGLSIWKGLFLHGHAGSPCFFPRTIKFMTRAKTRINYSQVIIHKFPLERIREAFDLAEKEKERTVKIMLMI